MSQWSLLASRQFFPQFMTQFLGACNNNIFKNALIILIVFHFADSLTLNAALLVALASGLFILPFFLFSTVAGQIADKYCKSQLVRQLKLLEILLTLAATIGFYWQNLSYLLAILFLLGVQAAFFGPLKYSILPELLQKEDLLMGNGLTGAATFIAILLGTIIGGVFIMYPQGPALISSIMLLLAISGWLSTSWIPKTAHTDSKQVINFHLLQEIRDLMRYAQARKPVLLSIMGISWFWLYGATILTLFPPFTKAILHGDETVVSFFLAIFSVGIALGSIIYTQIAKTKVREHVIYSSLIILSICTIDLSLSTAKTPNVLLSLSFVQFLSDSTHYRILGDACGMAFFGGLYTVPLYTAMQMYTPNTHRSRMIALNNIMNALFMTISALALMVLTSLGCSMQQIFLILSVGCSIQAWIFYRQRARIMS